MNRILIVYKEKKAVNQLTHPHSLHLLLHSIQSILLPLHRHPLPVSDDRMRVGELENRSSRLVFLFVSPETTLSLLIQISN